MSRYIIVCNNFLLKLEDLQVRGIFGVIFFRKYFFEISQIQMRYLSLESVLFVHQFYYSRTVQIQNNISWNHKMHSQNSINSPDQKQSVGHQSLGASSPRIVTPRNLSQPNVITYYVFISLLTIFVILTGYYSKNLQLETSSVVGPISQHIPIYAGEIHYARIPHEYWQHRILSLKAMGLNTLSVYIFWNYHEIQRGKFDFQTENKNLPAFLKLAQKHNMKVLIRPGPYVCAQWDFGGLPARLLGIQNLQIRSNNSLFQQQVKIYFQELGPILIPFLFKNGGPIIMAQIQNELGSFASAKEYTADLIQMWKKIGLQCEYYIEDASWFYQKNYIPGLHVGLSEGNKYQYYSNILLSDKWRQGDLLFGGEVYSGWLTHWGEEWNGKDIQTFNKQLYFLLSFNKSFSMYVAYGGTNFGLTAGANGFPYKDYMPHITSYDYDAPITENGQRTDKYQQIKRIFALYNPQVETLQAPQSPKTILIPGFKPKIVANLWSAIPQEPHIVDSDLQFFESTKLQMYNQGMAIYATILNEQRKYNFFVVVHDYAMIYVDQIYITTINRTINSNYSLDIQCKKPNCKLQILVQAMGHINYGQKQTLDRKGLLNFTDTANLKLNLKWNITKIPIDQSVLQWNKNIAKKQFPVLMNAEFSLSEVADTFFDMSLYGKGYLWVNDRLLGRYWSIGPQQRLYCPGVWLVKGVNKVSILQLTTNQIQTISGKQTLR